MGSDRQHGGSGDVVAPKGRKRQRQLLLESSDSEADESCLLTRHKSDEPNPALGNGDQSVEKVVPPSYELPGAKTTQRDGSEKNKGDELNSASSRKGDDLSEEKVVPLSSDKLHRVKSTQGDYPEKNKGDKNSRSSSQPDSKRSKIEDAKVGAAGNGGSASKDVTVGKMPRPGFPKWRFEKPEVRAGRVDEKGGVEMKATIGSKVKEQVSSLDDKRRHVELLKRKKHKPLKTDMSNSVDSGRQERWGETKAEFKEQDSSLDVKRKPVGSLKHEKHILLKTDKASLAGSVQREVIRVQGKSGLLKILPKNDKVLRETSNGKILPKKSDVDGNTSDGNTLPKNVKVEAGDDKVPMKSGVLKLLPKNNKMVRENTDENLIPKNIKLEGETSDGKILMKTGKMDTGSGDDKVATKNCMVDLKAVAGKIPSRNSRVDEETVTGYEQDNDKSSALIESQKRDLNGGKKVTGKLVSSVILRRSDPSVVGVSSGHTVKQKSSKVQPKISSQGNHQPSPSLKDEKNELGEHKNEKKRLLEHKGSPENLSKKVKLEVTDLQGTSDSAPKKHVMMKKPRGGPRNALKQKLRDQIKGILLHNGWTIDLRPRKDKDYEDSVYVSPQGSSYWSITKAYAVFQEQVKSSQDENPTGGPGVADASFDAISKEDLAMLQRIVRKRKGKKEHSAEKKGGDNRSRNSKGASAGRSSRNKYQNNKEKVKAKHQGCALLVRGSARILEGMGNYVPYKWKRTVLSWMIDLGVISQDAKVKYMNKKGRQAILDGRITRNGIYCGCCSKILTAAKFELHAGSKEHQPYANIFLEDGGIPLLQCLLDAWDKQSQYEKKGFYKIDPADDPDDDTCGICGDGGDLLCCDRCTSTFHVACLGIEMPSGDWYCRSCICKFCSSAEEMTPSFTELLSCLQCSRKYHQVCTPGTERDSVSTPPGASIDHFCSPGCRKIYKRLKKLLGFKNNMEAGFSWSLVRCFAESEAAPMKRKAELVYCNSKTAVAFSVMNECFLPRIDERSGINIIHNVVYNCGSDFNRLNFSEFYTFILEFGEEVISAASVRIHGTELAEMPFIGTRGMYRGQGMCHRLLNAIESVLCSLNVRRLVIPAIPEMQKTWTSVFGFKPVGPMKKQKMKSFNLLIIHGTGLLEKRLLLTAQVNRQTTSVTVECDKTASQTFGEATGSLAPVYVSQEFAVGGHPETKDHDTCALIEGSSGLASNLPPVFEEKTEETISPVSIADVNLHISEDDMPCKALADTTEKVKYAETDLTLVADKIVVEEKPEDKSISSSADSKAIPVTVDPCPCSSDELGKYENCPPSVHPVDDVLVKDRPESNFSTSSISGRFDNQEDKKSYVVPANTEVPLVTMGQKPDNHEFKTIVADGGDMQSSLEVKYLEVLVDERSIDAYAAKNKAFAGGVTSYAAAVTKDNGHSAVDLVVSAERSLDETNSVESDKSEVKVATIEVGAIVESSNEAGITVSALEKSDDINDEVTAKPTLTCGDGQLH
ncbi:hypothetical protein CFC21_023165 [Triticum aestivum]|uniref:PHD-type domain-containing protein n=3 Tax=Triticum TaxID=4564 RepID=A0A9R1PLP7_TRITD|nr:uncharacterized protein LOC123044837 [Triticum aestivum]KAF7008408.1 hypothetical protein CFC21_023165 [Triticum aestivum]VAH45813.1 unnamed protein product [Triticum turgidum subsp. durum]